MDGLSKMTHSRRCRPDRTRRGLNAFLGEIKGEEATFIPPIHSVAYLRLDLPPLSDGERLIVVAMAIIHGPVLLRFRRQVD